MKHQNQFYLGLMLLASIALAGCGGNEEPELESVPGTFNSETNTLSVTVDGTPHNYVLLEEAFVPVGADGDASPSFVVVLSDHSVNAVNALDEAATNADKEALSLWVAVVPLDDDGNASLEDVTTGQVSLDVFQQIVVASEKEGDEKQVDAPTLTVTYSVEVSTDTEDDE